MKKVKYLIITCLSIALLSFGVIAFANGGTNANSDKLLHDVVTGKFVALEDGNSKIKVNLGTAIETYPLDDSIWILRDKEKAVLASLKLGDKLEMVWNSSNKVAYIKAFSEEYVKAATAVASASPTPTPTLAPTATVKPEPSPKATPKVKVKDDNQATAAQKDNDNKIDYDDDQHDGDDNDHHDDKGNDHHEGKDNDHHGRNHD
jgi:hypothetical protein